MRSNSFSGGDVRHFLRHDKGNFAILFALASFLLVGVAGFAMDYSLRVRLDNRIQAAADAAVLAAVSDFQKDTAVAKAAAERMFQANVAEMRNVTFAEPEFVMETSPARVVYTVDYEFQPYFGAFYSAPLRHGSATATARAAFDPIDVALVLDSTGSMNEMGKLVELKTAATLFFESFSDTADALRVAVVPFDTQVHLERSDLPEELSTSEGVSAIEYAAWEGCVADRTQPFAASAAAAAYDAGDDAADPLEPETLYPRVACGRIGLATVLPLTAELATADAHIQEMKADGNTNLAIGVQWGLEALTPAAPLTGVRSSRRIRKVMIVLTDGKNTKDRWDGESNVDRLDDRARLACESVKKSGIEVYSIRLIDGNATLLGECASSDTHFYNVATASELTDVFLEISRRIRRVVLVN